MINKILPKSEFGRNVLTVMTGTVSSQVIVICLSPILTRLYSPTDFGIFALYLSVTAILAVVVTGRYEQAILLPKGDIQAASVFHLAVCISGISCAVIAFAVGIFQVLFPAKFSHSFYWLYFLPVGAVSSALVQALNYWGNRRKYYSRVARYRVIQSISTVLISILIGYFGVGYLGLVAGSLLGIVFTAVLMAAEFYRHDGHLIKRKMRLRCVAVAFRYRNFPKFLVAAHGMNAASSQIPVVLLSSFFGAVAAGFFSLNQRVVRLPSQVVAVAVGDIFQQEASSSFARSGQCIDVYKSTFKRLFLVSVGPFFVLALVAPYLFEIVFGRDWRMAGEYAQIMVPMFFLQFITSPLSTMFMIAEKQRLDLIWQSVLLLMNVVALYVGYLSGNEKICIALFCVSYSIMYSVNGVMTYKFAKGAG